MLIVSYRVGKVSDAAALAQRKGVCCISGGAYNGFSIDEANECVWLDGKCVIKKNDMISLDGESGQIFMGEITTRPQGKSTA